MRKVNDGAPITFFEITTAAAFWRLRGRSRTLFRSRAWGRLDATNVVETSRDGDCTDQSLITNSTLGNTPAEIAAKRRLFRNAVRRPLSLGVVAEVAAVIEAEAQRPEFKCAVVGSRMVGESQRRRRGPIALAARLPKFNHSLPARPAPISTAMQERPSRRSIFWDKRRLHDPRCGNRAGLTAVDWRRGCSGLTKGPLVSRSLPIGR